MSLETQLVALANQIGVDIATLQAALATAQTNLLALQAQVDAGGNSAPGITIEDLTELFQTAFGNRGRDFLEVYRAAVIGTLSGGAS